MSFLQAHAGEDREKIDTDVLRVNNNNLSDVSNLPAVLEQLLVNPLALAWLDLSFNHLETISPVSNF